MCGGKGKKGFFANLFEKLDKKMKASANASSCCCSGQKTKGNAADQDQKGCC